MGYAEEPLAKPQEFLKKKQNDNKQVEPSAGKIFRSNPSKNLKFTSCFVLAKDASLNKDRSQRKPPVPNIRDAPKMGTRTEKNFVQTNALDVVMTVPRKPERNIVDDRFGDKYPIDPSGLTPKYTFKKVFIFNYINYLFAS